MKNILLRPAFSARSSLAAVIALAVLMFVSGCRSVNYLREAQEAFNTAAAIETKARLDSESPDLESRLKQETSEVFAELSSVQGGYAAALLSLKRISSQDEAQLRQDKLWGVALALRALTEWKLGKHSDALQTADLAKQTASDQLFPRDAAVIEALPGLIKIDLAYAKILTLTTNSTLSKEVLDEEIRPRLVGPQGAVNDIHAARKKAGPSHPVNIYLIQSQLAAYRNYQVAHQKAHGSSPATNDLARLDAQFNLGDLQSLFNELQFGAAGVSLVNNWKTKYAIIPQSRPPE